MGGSSAGQAGKTKKGLVATFEQGEGEEGVLESQGPVGAITTVQGRLPTRTNG